MTGTEGVERELPPDDAGNLERQLLRERQSVDARGNGTLQRGRISERSNAGGCLRETRMTVIDADHAGVAQRRRKLLRVERVALGPLPDQCLDCLWQHGYTQALAGHFGG